MRKVIVACVAAAFLVGCELFQSLSAEKMMVATLLNSPPFSVAPVDLADAGSGMYDGGVVLDGGVLEVPPQAAMAVFFGRRQGQSLDAQPDPIVDATVVLEHVGGDTFGLTNGGDGTYSLSSLNESTFEYTSNATYRVRATHEGQTYVAELVQAPIQENIAELHPPGPGYIALDAGTGFEFTRADPGRERDLGFVMVYPIDDQGQQGQATYTNFPSDPVGIVKLIAAPTDWRRATVTIPDTAFPTPDSNYVIFFQAVKLGSATGGNLWTGSTFLAGTAEIGVVRTNP
jgi:hypothetical protein